MKQGIHPDYHAVQVAWHASRSVTARRPSESYCLGNEKRQSDYGLAFFIMRRMRMRWRACDRDIRKMRGMPAKYRASAAFPRHLI